MTACVQNVYNTKSFSGTMTAGETDTIIPAGSAAGRLITIVWARIVQNATTGAAIQMLADGDVILDVDPTTYAGTLENFPIDGRAITIAATGAGTAYYAGSYVVH